MQAFNRLLLTIIAMLIANCASFYDISDATHNKYTSPKAVDNNFNISGRFFIKTITDNEYGNFSWYKNENKEELNFNTPLGQTIAKIIIESTTAALHTGNKKIYSGANLDLLMLNNLGFSIPVRYLHYWMQGVALPGISVDGYTMYGFTQLGWKIEYLEWYNNKYPKIVKISKDNITIKLLLQW